MFCLSSAYTCRWYYVAAGSVSTAGGDLSILGSVSVIIGMLLSSKGFEKFYENLNQLKVTASQMEDLKNRVYYLDQCEKELEQKQYIMKNLLNSKEISLKDCNDACISLISACDKCDKAKEKLEECVHGIDC